MKLDPYYVELLTFTATMRAYQLSLPSTPFHSIGPSCFRGFLTEVQDLSYQHGYKINAYKKSGETLILRIAVDADAYANDTYDGFDPTFEQLSYKHLYLEQYEEVALPFKNTGFSFHASLFNPKVFTTWLPFKSDPLPTDLLPETYQPQTLECPQWYVRFLDDGEHAELGPMTSEEADVKTQELRSVSGVYQAAKVHALLRTPHWEKED